MSKKRKKLKVKIYGKVKNALYIKRVTHPDWDAVNKKPIPKEYVEVVIIPKYRKELQKIYVPLEQFRRENPKVEI